MIFKICNQLTLRAGYNATVQNNLFSTFLLIDRRSAANCHGAEAAAIFKIEVCGFRQ